MTKEEFIELVRISLPLNHNPLLVERYISVAYASFVKQFFNHNLFQTEYFTKEFTDVPVLRNDVTEFYYSMLPAKILNISRNGSGVYSIDATGSPELNFAPLPDRGFKVLSDLAVLKVSNMVPYTTIQSRVEYRKELIQLVNHPM